MSPKSALGRLERLQTAPHPCAELYAETLGELGLLRQDYAAFLLPAPFSVQNELMRLKNASLTQCAALLSAFLEEERALPGSFSDRLAEGAVAPVLSRMIRLLRRAQGLSERPTPTLGVIGFPNAKR